jgi:hypothetical protein
MSVTAIEEARDVNRIALHQSTVHPVDPVRLVEVAREAGLPSIGLRVAAVDEVQQWWSKGIGSAMLHALVPALLGSRVTVLDVGRVVLGPELRVVDGRHAYTRVLEIGVRLGAQFVTARADAAAAEDPHELFALLAELAGRYRLRPLITVVPGSPVGSLDTAMEVVAGTGGGVVLDVSPKHDTVGEVEERVVELGDALGYVRIPARELEDVPAPPGLLATLPPQVAVAIGGAVTGEPEMSGGIDADHVARVAALRGAVDTMLRHPRAADVR